MNHPRGYYRHQTRRVCRNRNKFLRMFRAEYLIDNSTVFDKRKPLDCGKPLCSVCHPDKTNKRRFAINGAKIEDMIISEWG